jgi:hypothetical protein
MELTAFPYRRQSDHEPMAIRLPVARTAAGLLCGHHRDSRAGDGRYHYAVFLDRHGVVETAALP